MKAFRFILANETILRVSSEKGFFQVLGTDAFCLLIVKRILEMIHFLSSFFLEVRFRFIKAHSSGSTMDLVPYSGSIQVSKISTFFQS